VAEQAAGDVAVAEVELETGLGVERGGGPGSAARDQGAVERERLVRARRLDAGGGLVAAAVVRRGRRRGGGGGGRGRRGGRGGAGAGGGGAGGGGGGGGGVGAAGALRGAAASRPDPRGCDRRCSAWSASGAMSTLSSVSASGSASVAAAGPAPSAAAGAARQL